MRVHRAQEWASVLAVAASIAGSCLWSQAAGASPGDLDTSFAGDGIVEFAIPHFDSYFDGALAAYPDARTVTVAVVLDGAGRQAFSVRRFTATGSPDPAFGAGGEQLVYFAGYEIDQPLIGGVAVQSDGKIVAAGAVCQSPEGTCNVAAFRLQTTGQFDPSFAWGGEIVVPMGYNSSVSSIAIDGADGSILIAGGAKASANDQATFSLLRLTSSGWPDSTFGSSGKAFARFSNGSAVADAMALQSTGKIVLAGRAARNGSNDMALARFNHNGSLDTTFGNGGEVTTPFNLGSTPGSSDISAIAVQSTDAIVVGGRFTGISGSPWPGGLMRRYTKDGTLDTAFLGGSGGMLSASFKEITGVAVQGGDKILGTGPLANQTQYSAFRLLPSGALDTGFGSSGYATFNGGTALSVMTQSYGCIMLGGFSATGTGAVVRLHGDPHAANLWNRFDPNSCAPTPVSVLTLP
jgi:uncharacterized delta-60 repeat protein